MDSTLYSQALLNKNALIKDMKLCFLYLARILQNEIFLITGKVAAAKKQHKVGSISSNESEAAFKTSSKRASK